MNLRNEAERIADNIACASQVDWASDKHRELAIINIEDGLRRVSGAGETYCTKCNGIGTVYTSPPEICERCGGKGAQP